MMGNLKQSPFLYLYLGGPQKHIPRTNLCYEGMEVTNIFSNAFNFLFLMVIHGPYLSIAEYFNIGSKYELRSSNALLTEPSPRISSS